MNPSSNEVSGEQLPTPKPEQAAVGAVPAEAIQPTAEQGPATAEKAPRAKAPAIPAPTIPLPASPTPVTPPQSNGSAIASSATAAILDDDDLIEKEWVNKAKQIVEKTRDDPYKQSEELTVVKADYMKKRYDKTIKISK
ncbi:MAG TPA: hypothetical protein VK534_00035 [Methylomirabilota bacterium]|nr:hypothetical protein [Methylomirabilota bacterium]